MTRPASEPLDPSQFSGAFWYALPIWVAYAALAPVAIYSFVNLVIVLLVFALGVRGWRGLARGARGMWQFAGPELTAVFGLWAVLVCIWSIAPGDAWGTLIRLAFIALAACAALSGLGDLTSEHLKRLHLIIIGSGFLLLGIYAFELAFGAPIAGALKDVYMGDVSPRASDAFYQQLYLERAHTKIARGMVALGAFSLPVAFLLWRSTRRWWPPTLWLAACFTIASFSHMSSVPIALGVALLATLVVRLFKRRGLRLLAAGACLFSLVLPVVMSQFDRAERIGLSSERLGISTQHRIQIYHYTSNLIIDRPLTGWGFRAARNLSDHAPSFVAAGYDAPFDDGQTILPLHPHNMSLQLWLETGFVGMALFCALLVLAAWRTDRARLALSQRMLIGSSATFLFVVANLSFGIWQFHWLSLMVLSAGAVMACCHRPRFLSEDNLISGR